MPNHLPTQMTAAVLMGHGGFDKLEIHHDWPVPQPQSGEVLIRVTACGVNNTDINTRVGWYDDAITGETNAGGADGFADVKDTSSGSWAGTALPFPRIQGADVVGRVVAVGEGVPTTWLEQRVMADPCLRDWDNLTDYTKTGYIGSERDGGFAQYVALPITNVKQVGGAWSDVALATLPCSYTTAENMLTRAGVSAGERVLITGASGGVGSALIQLAKRRQTTVIALTSASKADQIRSIGADVIIRRGVDDWKSVLQSNIGAETVDVVADVVGGDLFAQLLTVMRRGARYVTSGAIGGKSVRLDLSHLYLRDWQLLGATVTATDVFPNLVRYVEAGEIQPLLARSYALTEIHQAQEDFLAKRHIGKLVLIPPE